MDNFENLNNNNESEINPNLFQTEEETAPVSNAVSVMPQMFQEAENKVIMAEQFSQQTEFINSQRTETPRRKGRFASVAAAALAIAVIGGAAGFGGAYFGNNIFTQDSQPSTVVQIPETKTASVNGEKDEEVYLVTDTLAKNNATKEMNAADLYAYVEDTVVAINLYQTGTRGREEVSGIAGSGVIFSTDGYVLTNHHVIVGTEKIGVIITDTAADGTVTSNEYMAEIVGMDEGTDLAVLKISRDGGFKAAAIGDSSSLRMGQEVCALGYPLGLAKSITNGIVSGLNREVESGGYELSSIQIDAAVNMGNSGGPLFDMYGNVVGIVNKKLVYDNLVENMGFAITIDEAKPIINDLLNYGKVASRPVLGITTSALNEYSAQMYGFDITSGLLVNSINRKAPVASSGLAVGDIIVKVNEKDVASVSDVQTQTKTLKAGDTIKVTVVRYNEFGEKQEVVLTVELADPQALE